MENAKRCIKEPKRVLCSHYRYQFGSLRVVEWVTLLRVLFACNIINQHKISLFFSISE